MMTSRENDLLLSVSLEVGWKFKLARMKNTIILFVPSKFCIIVSSFSWDHCKSQKERQTKSIMVFLILANSISGAG